MACRRVALGRAKPRPASLALAPADTARAQAKGHPSEAYAMTMMMVYYCLSKTTPLLNTHTFTRRQVALARWTEIGLAGGLARQRLLHHRRLEPDAEYSGRALDHLRELGRGRWLRALPPTSTRSSPRGRHCQSTRSWTIVDRHS